MQTVPVRPSMRMVAEAAGVSMMTVSRALRHPDKVAAATRRKVQRAAENLGYVPDLVAASLASRRSRVIAMVVPTVASSLFDDSIQGVADVARQEGYQIILGESRYSQDEEESLATALLGRRPDGIILTGVVHSQNLRTRLATAGLPVVETWDTTPDPIDSLVGFSNERAGFEMTEKLVSWGYRTIAFMGNGQEPRSVARRRGYERCLSEKGMADKCVSQSLSGQSMREAGERFVALLDSRPEIDAVFFAQDMAAAAAVFACQRRGWAIPERVAIAGFGDLEIADQIVPALTTVRVPRYQMGADAARLIIDRLASRVTMPVSHDLGFEVLRRASA